MPPSILRKVSQLFGKNDDSSRPIQDILTDKHQSRDAFPSIPHNSPVGDIPTNILAFRTITKLLSQIQQERPFVVLQAKPLDNQRQELKITNAFATVAVIEHEVVAVVTNRITPTLGLTACVQSPIDKNTSITPSGSLSSKLVSQVWGLLFTQNYRRSDPKLVLDNLPIGEPTIIDAKTMAGLDLVEDDAIKKYAEEYWSGSTIAKHLWITVKLLTMKEPTTSERNPTAISTRLLPYVIATCYPKMRRRLKNRNVSIPYIESLKKVKAWKFEESMDSVPQPEALEEDRRFVVNYFLPTAELEKADNTSSLIKQAQLIAHNKTSQLYTKETCVEFHRMLLHLISQFRLSLDALYESRGPSKPPTMASEAFKTKILLSIAYGYALQRLAKGAALEMHLKNIAPLLRRNLTLTRMDKSTDEEQEELDEDLKAVQPSVTQGGVETPVWMSYLNWLRLMIAHFDAVQILVDYVTGRHFRHEAISIQILVTPPVDDRLLPWQELFLDSNLFPIHTNLDPLAGIGITDGVITNVGITDSSISNTDILDFLCKALETSSEAEKAKEAWNRKDVNTTIKCLETLQTSNLTSWVDRAKKLLVTLNHLNGRPGDDLFNVISAEIQSLCDGAKFFNTLNDNKPFTGTLHCEACLASLLAGTTSAIKDISARMEGFGRIIGISKRCCPTCQQLLLLLGTGKAPFVVRGSHSTVTACTLPTWLPAHVVDSMNNIFGDRLRRELLNLIESSELLRKRAQSTGSQRLSSDSTEQPGNDNPISMSKDFLRRAGVGRE